jgi:serine/threonine-protein kinase
MSPDRWRLLDEICQDVLERQPADRSAFLDRACADDPSLRAEVEALVRSQESVGSFLQTPAIVVKAALLAGQTIGTYKIKLLVGVGGMGEVYRAHDMKLGRDIALKVLPKALGSDRERMSRFEREARVLASLNHPGIAQIYGVEESAIAMEFVPGPTLAERIGQSGQGGLPLREALAIAKQLAEAVEYAHDRNVIHRDLKPANIKVTPDDTVKVLDFGLAEALVEEPRNRCRATPLIPPRSRRLVRLQALFLAPPPTCRRKWPWARRRTGAATSGVSASCCLRCWRAGNYSAVKRPRRFWRQ